MGNLIDLTKKARVVLEKKNLQNVAANIVLAMDKSGSMSYRFSNGVVQEVVTRLLALGMNMDVNKNIDVYAFDTSSQYVGTANENNHSTFIKKSYISASGGTNYAPVMKQIINKYGTAIEPIVVEEKVPAKGFFNKLMGKTETVTKTIQPENIKAQEYPTIVFFVTDGNNFDTKEAEYIIREVSKQGIFWQFVGIGNESFDFLTHLDEMAGRYADNANFFSVNDIMKISDEELYTRILNEVPSWLNEAKAKGLVL